MEIVLNTNTLIGIAGLITALGVIIGSMWKAFDQKKKYDEYDSRIKEVNKKIEEMQTENMAKMQSVMAEQCMQTYVLQAVLEGLHQLHCNGPVTEARDKLSKYINKQAHDLPTDQEKRFMDKIAILGLIIFGSVFILGILAFGICAIAMMFEYKQNGNNCYKNNRSRK